MQPGPGNQNFVENMAHGNRLVDKYRKKDQTHVKVCDRDVFCFSAIVGKTFKYFPFQRKWVRTFDNKDFLTFEFFENFEILMIPLIFIFAPPEPSCEFSDVVDKSKTSSSVSENYSSASVSES